MTGDPLFADDGAGYRIGKESPCFDAGKKLDWCSRRGKATDFEGNERKCGAVDIGCSEFPYVPGFLLFVR